MKTVNSSIISQIINFFGKQKVLSSFIVCLIIYLIYFAISGFNIISGNDEYCIFKLIYFGDTDVVCSGYFLNIFISAVQPLFGNLNSYMIVQELLCCGSLVALTFVFFSISKNKFGVLVTVLFDIVCFSFIPFNILFTLTSIISCTSGIALLVYASMFEQRRNFRIFQEIISLLLVFAGAQVRFPPFEALGAVFAAFAAGVLVASFLKSKKNSTAKKAIVSTIKKYLKTGVLVILAAIIAFGADFASTAFKQTIKGYEELADYNNALASAVDYESSPYFSDKEFYNSIGMKSVADLNTIKHWFIDEDFFTAEKLRAISNHSKNTNKDALATKGAAAKILYPVGESFGKYLENGAIIFIAMAVFIVLCIFAMLAVFLPKRRSMIFRLAGLILLWTFFYLVAGGFVINNILTIPLMLLSLYICVKCDGYSYLTVLALILAVIVMYFYMSSVRLYFHVSAAFIIPAFVFMVFLLNDKRENPPVSKSNPTKTLTCIISILLVISSVICSLVLYGDLVYVGDRTSNPALRQYINDNPDTVFYVNQTCLSKDYYNPIVMDEEPKNIVNYGLWVGKSDYMKSTRERNGIKHVFKDAINSNVMIPIYEAEDEKGVAVSRFADMLEEYYNEHYAEKGKTIKVKKADNVGRYALYKIITEKTKKK